MSRSWFDLDNGGIPESDAELEAMMKPIREKMRQEAIHKRRCEGQRKRREREALHKFIEGLKNIKTNEEIIHEAWEELKNLDE